MDLTITLKALAIFRNLKRNHRMEPFNRLSHKRRHRHSNLKSTGSSNNATFDPEWLKERLPFYKKVGFLAKLKRDTFALQG